MTQPQYLQLTDKWQALLYWVSAQPGLTRSGLIVLIRLLDHQNPKTGRCDPSAQTIQDKTHLCERSVRNAISELKVCGAISTTRKTLRSRNQVVLRKVEDLKNNTTKCIGRNHQSRVHSCSDKAALACRSSLHPTAPEKEKKKNKEKGQGVGTSHQLDNWNKKTGNHKCYHNDLENQGTDHRGQFERSVVKVLEKKGFNYSDLLLMDSNSFEDIYRSYSSGKITFSKALDAIISECKAAKRQ